MLITERRVPGLVLALFALSLPATASSFGPDIAEWRTDNGVRVLFIEAREIPVVNAQLAFAAGSARDGDLPGVAGLTADALLGGAGDMDADELASAFERHGANVGTGAARDMAWVSLQSLADDRQLGPVVDTLAGMLARPAFPADELDRLLDGRRTALDQQERSPGAIADRLFWETAYAGHPYGSNPTGTRASLDAITPADLREFHERYYVGANASLAIVGDLDRAAAERLADRLVASLPRGEPAGQLPLAPELADDVTRREPFPSTQAHVIIGRPAVARGYDAWPAVFVANHSFGGGGFTGRLMDEVRQKRGLVYGIYSYFSPMQAEGPFRVVLQTRGDQEDEALGVVRDELDRFLRDGPTADETEASAQNITGGLPLQIDSNSNLVGQLAVTGFYDLPLDRLERFRRAVGAVDAGIAHRAFLDAVGHRPRVTVIVGGDRARDDGRQAD